MHAAAAPETDLAAVVDERVREWHFHIYFLLQSEAERAAALALRDAVLRLRRDGAFVAVPLHRVNTYPMGPHPAGSYENSSFSDVFFYLASNRGSLSVLVHPLSREQRRDHELRNAWMGTPWPLFLDGLPVKDDVVQLQYPVLGLGWSAPKDDVSLDERRRRGAEVERLLMQDPQAAPAPE